MPNGDFSCSQCTHFALASQNGSGSWHCARYGTVIDHQDPCHCVCRAWRPAAGSFAQELGQYLAEVAPGALHHLRSRELYRTVPECELMALT